MDGNVSRQTKLIVELLERVDEMLLRTDGLLSPDYPVWSKFATSMPA